MTAWVRGGLLGVILAAFALRMVGLGAQELRGEEAFGYFFSLQPPGEILERTLDLAEPHPVASYWLQHAWLAAAGDHEVALRLPSAWWNTLVVALIAHLAHCLRLGDPATLLAALLLAVSPYAVWHGQDARMHSMSLALTLAATIVMVRWLARPRMAMAAAYVGLAWLALHTHYFAVFVISAHALYVLGRCLWLRQGRLALAWLATLGLLSLLYLPWLLAAREVLTGYTGNGDSPGVTNALERALTVMVVGEASGPAWRILWALLAAVAVVAGLTALFRGDERARQSSWLLIAYACVPLIGTWISSTTRPIFDERYLVAAAPPVYLLMAAGVGTAGTFRAGRWRQWGVAVPVALVIVGMAVGLVRTQNDPAYSKNRGWRDLAVRLEELTSGVPAAQARLVQNYPDPTLWYYYRGPVAHLVLPPAAYDGVGARREVADLAEAGVERVVLVEQASDRWDDQGVARTALENRYAEVVSVQTRWPVVVYEQRREQLPVVNVTYTNGLRLSGAEVVPATLEPGGLVAVHLDWETRAARPAGDEKVSLQLLDEAGRLVAQTDVPLTQDALADGVPVGYGILVPDGLRGTYTVSLVVYDPEAPGAAPRVATVDGADMVILGRLAVVDDLPPGP